MHFLRICNLGSTGFILMLCMALFYFNPTKAGTKPNWGKTGHRVVGAIAQKHLKPSAARAVKKLLNGQNLAAVANYADEIRSDSLFYKYGPWHYVNFSYGKKYGVEAVNQKGDLIQAIETCIKALKNKNTPLKQQQFYLKMLVHFMGDLHQPLHVGRGSDRGGMI